MRYIAAQFVALLTGDRWRKYAAHANAMTALLHERLQTIDGLRITREVRCNVIFATLERAAIERIGREYFFYIFDESLPEVRWMTHWATTPQDVEQFAACVRGALAQET